MFTADIKCVKVLDTEFGSSAYEAQPRRSTCIENIIHVNKTDRYTCIEMFVRKDDNIHVSYRCSPFQVREENLMTPTCYVYCSLIANCLD